MKLYVWEVKGGWFHAARLVDDFEMAEYVVQFNTVGNYTDVLLRAPQHVLNEFRRQYQNRKPT